MSLLLLTAAALAAPYVVVLGTAQDGGVPQIACTDAPCRAARAHPRRARHVTSLLVVDPEAGRRWLIDATPDLPAQVELARAHGHPDGPGRPALFDGILLTHAHTGHYAGLIHLGREAYGTAPTPVYGTARMQAFLAGHGPWSLLIDAGHLTPRPLVPGETIPLSAQVHVEAFEVRHRDEFTDTVGFLVHGPSRTLAYLPDTDKWGPPVDLPALLGRADVALLDATFFDGDELPGRDMAEVPHPFVVETLTLLAPLGAELRDRVHLTHLNHGNPLLTPGSPARRAVRRAGVHVARDGDVHPL